MEQKTSQIVVITDTKDAHLPMVQKHLAQPFIVIDPRAIVKDNALTFEMKDGLLAVFHGDVALDNVTSVWYRKPRVVTADMLPIAQEYKDYSLSAIRRHAMLLLTAFQNALWISDFYAMHRASDKTLQLEIAARIGFTVPDTIFSSDTQRAEQFIRKHATCIMKPITPYTIETATSDKFLYATRIEAAHMPNLDNLAFGPMIFQQAIEPIYDVRATVVGDQVFAAAIDKKSSTEYAHVRDWRIGRTEGNMRIWSLPDFPKDVAAKCIAHTKALGLNFGAIDLILDKHGTYWFLENNPNGQWGFVEEATKQPIGKALATVLNKGPAGSLV
jgi:glutathione synthase/RimK-type ligase-like ATP-grasp enzyme